MVRKIIGIGFISLGIAAGLYLGVWYGFIGGLVQGIPMLIHGPIVVDTLIWDIVRVLFSEFAGVTPFLIFGLIGAWIYPTSTKYRIQTLMQQMR